MSREYSANVEPLYGDVISYSFAKASEAYIAFSNMRPEFDETSAIAADKIEEMAIHKISRVHPALTKARITVMREMQRENLKAVELTHNVGLSRSRIDNSMTHER